MSLRKQAVSLAILHAADVLQPLIILPYAAKVLQPANYGQYAYAMSVGQLAATVVGYGFHWTAQRAAAAARGEPGAIAAICAEVAATKALLFAAVLLAGLALTDGALAIGRPIFLCAMLIAVGDIVFPSWLFIAMERAWHAAMAVVAARLLALVGFLVLVKSPDQLPIAVAMQAGIPIVSGLICLPFALRVGFGGFRTVTPARLARQLREGARGFLFTLVETALLVLPVPLVEHFSGFAAAGQFSVAEKFVGVTRPFSRVMSETFLPRVAYYAKHDPRQGIALIRRAFWTLVVGAALSLLLYAMAPFMITRLFGGEFADAIAILRILAIVPVLLNLNVCTSNLYMFNFGHERAWAWLTLFGLVTFLAAAFGLAQRLPSGAIAVAMAIVARQCVVFLVSGGFFLWFAPGRARASRTPAAGEASEARVFSVSQPGALFRQLRS